MNRKKKLVLVSIGLLGGSCIVLCVALWKGRERARLNTAAPDTPPPPSLTVPASPALQGPAAVPASESHPTPVDAQKEHYSFFSADATGNLVLSETTRLNLEKLHALNSPDEFLAKLKELSAVLPAKAHAELLSLAANYVGYIDALQTAFPPDAEVQTVGEAESELKGIHELRQKHFGPERASALYGEEEKLNRQMIELMALEADSSLPLAEKAHRAQQLLKTDTTVESTDGKTGPIGDERR